MKTKEIRELTDAELVTKVADLQREKLNLKIQSRTGQLEKTARVREIRRDIATDLTDPGGLLELAGTGLNLEVQLLTLQIGNLGHQLGIGQFTDFLRLHRITLPATGTCSASRACSQHDSWLPSQPLRCTRKPRKAHGPEAPEQPSLPPRPFPCPYGLPTASW